MFSRLARLFALSLLVLLALPLVTLAQFDPAAIHEAIPRFVDQAFNQGNIDAVDEMFAEDYVSHFDEADREAFKEDIRATRAAFPDLVAHVDNVVVQGAWAAFRWIADGTFTGEYVTPQGTFPPTGKPVHLEVNIFLRYNDEGKVAEEWDYLDNLSFLMQLGVIPSSTDATEAAPMPAMPMMTEAAPMASGMEDANLAVTTRLLDALNAGDLPGVEAIVSPSYLHHRPGGVTLDIPNWEASLIGFATAMPDLHFTADSIFAEDSYVALRLTARGTFTGQLMMPDGSMLPGNGAEIEAPIGLIYRLDENGAPVEAWEQYDQLSLFTLLGAISMDSAS